MSGMKRFHLLAAAICVGAALELQAQTPGTVKWTLPLTNATTASPALAVDGTIYIADGKGLTYPWRLWAVNPNGTVKWQYALAAGAASSPAVDTNGAIYLFDVSGQISAVSPYGTNLWPFPDDAGGYGYGHPAIAPDGTIYVCNANALIALSPAGVMEWIYFSDTNYYLFDYASPAIAVDGTIYANGNDGKLYALNKSDGSLKWALATPEAGAGFPMHVSPPTIGSDGTIYCGVEVGATNAYFLAVRPGATNATIKWAYADNSVEAFGSGAAIGSDGTLYVQSTVDGSQGYLYAFDPKGAKKWTYPIPAALPASVISTPAIAADGAVYVGGNDGRLYAINSDGSLRWATTNLAISIQSSPSIGQDGTVYVAGNGAPAALFAIYGSAPPACSFWPEYAKNSRHSGSTSPLTIKQSGFGAGRQFQLAITGTTGIVCSVCGSTDLVTWTNVGTLSLTAAMNAFADAQATNFSRRFYRTSEQ